MKKIILIALVLSLGVLVAARVRTGAIAGDVLGTTGAGINSTGTNQLLGYLSPKSAVSSIDINIGAAFTATTNNFINVFGVYTIYTNSVSSTLTNYFLIDQRDPFGLLTATINQSASEDRCDEDWSETCCSESIRISELRI